MTKANEFVEYMIERCKIDGRLVALIGPLSKAYDLMVAAYSEAQGLNVEEFEEQYAKVLRACRKWQEA